MSRFIQLQHLTSEASMSAQTKTVGIFMSLRRRHLGQKCVLMKSRVLERLYAQRSATSLHFVTKQDSSKQTKRTLVRGYLVLKRSAQYYRRMSFSTTASYNFSRVEFQPFNISSSRTPRTSGHFLILFPPVRIFGAPKVAYTAVIAQCNARLF